LTDDCEIIISDDASPDDTEKVVAQYAHKLGRFSYVRQNINLGCDGNIDFVMRRARGEYCWLMPDDDWMKPGAVCAVLDALRGDYSLVVVNKEIRDGSMADILVPSYLGIRSDRTYMPNEMDRLLVEAGILLLYCGSVVMKQAIWSGRETKRYYGTSFVQVGAVFEAPLPGKTLVMEKPLITFRHSLSHGWIANAFEISLLKLPELIWSLALSESAKRKFVSPEPWRQFDSLLQSRGCGLYSIAEYKRLIRPRVRSLSEKLIPVFVALVPGTLANALCVLRLSVSRDRLRKVPLQWLKESRFYLRNRARKQNVLIESN
jgi:abequosyltransferase